MSSIEGDARLLAGMGTATTIGQAQQRAWAIPWQRPTRPVLPTRPSAGIPTEWNRTTRNFPDNQTLHALFVAQVRRTPQAVAVCDDRESLTYDDLDRWSDRIARSLAAAGAGVDTRIGLCIERSVATAAALLGILKTGAAYVPLDPSYPVDRIGFMVEDAGCLLVLTDPTAASVLPPGVPRLVLDNLVRAASDPPLEPLGTGADLAYVIYTSGSTGRPKGVELRHRGVVNLLHAIRDEIGFAAADRLLAVTSISFDISVLEFFLPLLFGGSLFVATRAEAADGERLLVRLEAWRATLLQATPVTFRLLLRAGWQGSPGLKLLCGGEAIDPELGRQLIARADRFWNVYGPTETTIWSTAHEVRSIDGSGIPIGRPLANTRLHILDTERRPVPVGEAGELYIAGAGVARGYRGRPELTAERFLPDPGEPGERMYRTGDLARYRPDGAVEFIGRNDHQIKIRGFRIELGEIEAVLSEQPGVEQAVVVARSDPADEMVLVAFVVAGTPTLDLSAVKRWARTRLPAHMVPARLLRVASLPLTPNGKVDRRRLSSMPIAEEQRPAACAQLEAAGPLAAPSANPMPPDPVAARIVAIFEEVLQHRPVGVHDDFFDLGGDSIRAVRLLELIGQHCGKRLHLNTLYHRGASAAYLAAALQHPGDRTPLAYLLPLGSPLGLAEHRPAEHRPAEHRPTQHRPIQEGRPIFCLHTLVEGTLFNYEELAERLSHRYRFLGILPRGFEDGLSAHASLPEMAAHAVAQMRSRQPFGPYRLLGFSSAGTLAFETARQLREAGAEIELLGLIDALCPLVGRSWDHDRALLTERMVRLWQAVGSGLRNPRTLWGRDAAADRALRWRHRWGLRTYRPGRYDGPVRLVVARETAALVHDERLGWAALAGDIACETLPGGHFDIVNEPGVAALADMLLRWLDEAAQPACTAA